MKTYDFSSREMEYGRVVFVLSLNRKRMTERIVIGKAEDVRDLLSGGDSEVFYDEVRPLGSLLFTFESDMNGEWNSHILNLKESYEFKYSFGSARWNKAAPVSEFLTEKYKSGEPSAMFAAVRTWDTYLNCFHMNYGANILADRLFMLYKPFRVYSEYRPWQKEAAHALADALRDGDSQVELWYPVAKRPFETVVALSSFLPIIFYYIHKVEEWRLVFQECKVCNKYFLARSRHYELCSDECRKHKAVEAKRDFDERAKDNKLEQLDDAAYQYWYNRWRKLKKGKFANPDAAAAFKAALGIFRKESKIHKAAVKSGKLSLTDFSSWLAQQQNEADRLIEGFKN